MSERPEPDRSPNDGEELQSPSTSSDGLASSVDPGERFGRLLEGGPEDEGLKEHHPDRHPTGTPGMTGGWMSEVSDTPPSEPHRERTSSSEDSTPEPSEPLPQRVPVTDLDATHVVPSAYTTGPSGSGGEPTRPGRKLGCGGCMLRMLIMGLFAAAALLIGVVSFGLYQYASLASTLPPVEDLKDHAAQFETTRILDRDGNLKEGRLYPMEAGTAKTISR